MIGLVLNRLAGMVGVVLVLVAVIFCLQRVVPGDPIRLMVGARASVEAVEAKRRELGMDRPLLVQYVAYIGDLAQGDLQTSLRTRRPVAVDLAEFFPATLELIGTSLLMAVAMGSILGLSAAGRWRGFAPARMVLIGGSAIPVFLLAMVGVLIFYRHLQWLPVTGRTALSNAVDGPTGLLLIDALLSRDRVLFLDALRHIVLPAFCLSLAPAVGIGRVFRSSLLGALRADYIRTARAKGLTERRVLFGHAVRNSLGPTLSIGGLQIAIMFANVVVVESIFAWPGIGLYTSQSIERNDFPAIAGVTLVLGVLYIAVNAIVDVLQVLADPRLRALQ